MAWMIFVRVGAARGTATVGYLDRERVSHRYFPNPQAGLRALQEGQIEAFVYDRPLLNWIVMQQFPHRRGQLPTPMTETVWVGRAHSFK